ncbi:scavenger receptor class B member 1-like [Anneissia japonica]|uniref:scavenger receptor class B member 1-like n=1 Tax=Anneissia japonica TaxID=1529436 RepID=UPI001425767C|nr:scavenger receptor class B member 1-like [Anneissia japonica]
MVYKTPYCLGTVGIAGCLAGLFLIPFVFNVVLTSIVNKMMVISPSSPIYTAWKNADIPIFENFYFFEVLNPEEALNGEKPQLKERGPYVYSIKMPKENVSFHDNETVSFEQRFTYIFEEHLSAGPENETFMMINLPLSTIVSMFEDFPEFLKTGMSATLRGLGEEMFLPMSPKKLLWGYEEPFFKFVKSFTGNLFFDSDIFGLFLGRNNTGLGVFNVQTGETNRTELNNINTWKYMKELPWWSGYGNMINGTDGFMYHPFISKDERLYLFNPDLCRSVSYVYNHDTSYRGVPLWLFSLDHFTYANSSVYPPNADFCSENCPPSGTFPVSKCRQNSPISLSNPHFLDTDKELQDSVGGLTPNEKLHLHYMSLERIMGMPFDLAIRIQLNIQTRREPSISIVRVDDTTLHKYNGGIALSQLFSTIMKYCIVGIGALLVTVAVILFIRSKKKDGGKKILISETEPLLN